MTSRQTSNAAAALAVCRRGDFRQQATLAEQLGASPRAGDRAWALALRAARWHAEPRHAPLPRATEVEALLEGCRRDPLPLSLTLAELERAAVLRFDTPALRGLVALQGRLGEKDLWSTIGGHWLALLEDRTGGLDGALAALEATAARQKEAALVIEAAALRALAHLQQGETGPANDVARRASRMARTEALPQWEYLAHVVLARVRRQTAKPFAATRILSALAKSVSPPWLGWICWELLLAGSRQGARALVDRLQREPPLEQTSAPLALDALLAAAEAGERDAFDAVARRLRRRVRHVAPLADDLHRLRLMLDPTLAPRRAPRAMGRWLLGETDTVPAGMHGLCLDAEGESAPGGRTGTWVHAPADRPARRVAAPGLGLALAAGSLRVQPTRRRSSREDSALAALALAGGTGLAVEPFFRRVYGFAYVPELHEGVLRVLLHRLRERLGESGRVVARKGHVWLQHHGALLIPDPRCSSAMDERVLLNLARLGRASARATARDLGMPLRTVQAALRQLIGDGMCRLERKGRSVHYVLEDTTFSEPTTHT